MLAELQPISEISSEQRGTAWKRRAAEKRGVVRGEQSQYLSPSDPVLAPTSLRATAGMWPLIAWGGRQQTGHCRPLRDNRALFTRLYIEYSCMQVLTIWI